MKAVRIHGHGGPEVLTLEEIEAPRPAAGEVAIEVEACALNHLDLWTRRGRPGLQIAMPRIPGSDVSGRIAEVGDGVSGLAPGDEVVLYPLLTCGRCPRCLQGRDNECAHNRIVGYQVNGGYAERLVVPAANVFSKPKNLSFTEAASVPLVFLTAWHMLVARGGVRPGDDVLVNAAGSGVGSAAVQIARLWGARVFATASTEEKRARAEELGAAAAINYREKDVAEEVRRLTEGKGADVVIEHAGAETFAQSCASLARGGRIVTCGATTGPRVELDLRQLYTRYLSVQGSWLGTRAELVELLSFFESGRLRPVVDRVLPLAEADEAHRLLEKRSVFGKLVLEV